MGVIVKPLYSCHVPPWRRAFLASTACSPRRPPQCERSEGRQPPNRLQEAVAALLDGMVPRELLKDAVSKLGTPGRSIGVRDMAKHIDGKLGADGVSKLYDLIYAPTSNYFSHANAGSLIRHVRPDDKLSSKPNAPWLRRSPVRLADASVGILAVHLARSERSRPTSSVATHQGPPRSDSPAAHESCRQAHGEDDWRTAAGTDAHSSSTAFTTCHEPPRPQRSRRGKRWRASSIKTCPRCWKVYCQMKLSLR